MNAESPAADSPDPQENPDVTDKEDNAEEEDHRLEDEILNGSGLIEDESKV